MKISNYKKHDQPQRRQHFTLVEVLVAIAILGMSLVLILQMLDASRRRLVKAERRWSRRHLVEQATEFYLLAGSNARVPDGLLPEGYEAEAQFLFASGARPERYRGTVGGWMLGTLRVKVYDANDDVLIKQDINKVVPENEL